MATRRCETCEFWDQGGMKGTVDWGMCHRYPPPSNDTKLETDLPPTVWADCWCGEWRLKEAEGTEDGLATF